SPSTPGITTISTGRERRSFSGETSSNWMRSAMVRRPRASSSRRLGGHLAGLLDRLLDGSHHIEGALRQIVVLARNDALEAADGVLEVDQHAIHPGEDRGDVEGLR